MISTRIEQPSRGQLDARRYMQERDGATFPSECTLKRRERTFLGIHAGKKFQIPREFNGCANGCESSIWTSDVASAEPDLLARVMEKGRKGIRIQINPRSVHEDFSRDDQAEPELSFEQWSIRSTFAFHIRRPTFGYSASRGALP
jgi:hypothetical protein